jgi:hypothetical protein
LPPLLPADTPIVDALRLPERLTHVSTPVYTIGRRISGRLAGALCADAETARAAEAAGADFIAILHAAWELGASGLNQTDG